MEKTDRPLPAWPQEPGRVPYWVYTDGRVYERELARIFNGPTWSYVGLECEIPEPGNYKRTVLGEQSVLVVRGKDGQIRVLANRCAHRGVELCQSDSGKVQDFMCPYHQWVYVLEGRLRLVYLDPPSETILDPDTPGLVLPQQPHLVEPLGAVKMRVDFYDRPPGG